MEQFTADAESWIDERANGDGPVCLELVELDMAGANRLEDRLQALAEGGDPVVLDLHGPQFIDSSGLRVLVGAIPDARRDNRTLVFDGTLSPQVRQIIDLLELRDLFCRRPGLGPRDAVRRAAASADASPTQPRVTGGAGTSAGD